MVEDMSGCLFQMHWAIRQWVVEDVSGCLFQMHRAIRQWVAEDVRVSLALRLNMISTTVGHLFFSLNPIINCVAIYSKKQGYKTEG